MGALRRAAELRAQREADLRMHYGRLRNFCESVTFFGGQARELQLAEKLLDIVIASRLDYVVKAGAGSPPSGGPRGIFRLASGSPKIGFPVVSGAHPPPPPTFWYSPMVPLKMFPAVPAGPQKKFPVVAGHH